MARYDDLDTGTIAYTTFVSSILLLIIILLGRALSYAWMEAEDERKLANARYTSSDEIVAEQLGTLKVYKTVEVEVVPPADAVPDAGSPEGDAPTEERLHIPIERAKDMLLKELGQPPST